jgi:hypothetical protein
MPSFHKTENPMKGKTMQEKPKKAYALKRNALDLRHAIAMSQDKVRPLVFVLCGAIWGGRW